MNIRKLELDSTEPSKRASEGVNDTTEIEREEVMQYSTCNNNYHKIIMIECLLHQGVHAGWLLGWIDRCQEHEKYQVDPANNDS